MEKDHTKNTTAAHTHALRYNRNKIQMHNNNNNNNKIKTTIFQTKDISIDSVFRIDTYETIKGRIEEKMLKIDNKKSNMFIYKYAQHTRIAGGKISHYEHSANAF